jgi:hypothetical protein
MEDYERTALKAACIQAAAILVGSRAATAAQPGTPPFGGRGTAQTAASASTAEPDTGACARYARDLFGKLTGEPWD